MSEVYRRPLVSGIQPSVANKIHRDINMIMLRNSDEAGSIANGIIKRSCNDIDSALRKMMTRREMGLTRFKDGHKRTIERSKNPSVAQVAKPVFHKLGPMMKEIARSRVN